MQDLWGKNTHYVKNKTRASWLCNRDDPSLISTLLHVISVTVSLLCVSVPAINTKCLTRNILSENICDGSSALSLWRLEGRLQNVGSRGPELEQRSYNRYRLSTLMLFIDLILDWRQLYSVSLLLKSCIENFSLVSDKSIGDQVIDNIAVVICSPTPVNMSLWG